MPDIFNINLNFVGLPITSESKQYHTLSTLKNATFYFSSKRNFGKFDYLIMMESFCLQFDKDHYCSIL